jgi:hypothetical protein
MTTTQKYEATCAVCFRVHKLYAKGNLVRHGFNIVNRENGVFYQAWHTGPCGGIDFPHFGISTEGTEWALGQVKSHLARAQERLAHLQTRPTISWSADNKWDIQSGAQRHDLNPGDERRHVKFSEVNPEYKGNSFNYYVVPAYEAALKSRVSGVEGTIRSDERQIVNYEEAIRTWEPKDAVPVKSQKVVHKAANWKNKAGIPAAECKKWGMSRPEGTAALTENASGVTCKACLKGIEKVKEEKAKKVKEDAENKTYRVVFPDKGGSECTTNKRESSKREFISAVVAKSSYDGRWSVAKWAVSDATAKKAVRECRNGGWDSVQIVSLEVITREAMTEEEAGRLGKWDY